MIISIILEAAYSWHLMSCQTVQLQIKHNENAFLSQAFKNNRNKHRYLEYNMFYIENPHT